MQRRILTVLVIAQIVGTIGVGVAPRSECSSPKPGFRGSTGVVQTGVNSWVFEPGCTTGISCSNPPAQQVFRVEVVCTTVNYGSENPAPWVTGMAEDELPLVERGLLAMSDAAWDQALRRTVVITPLAALDLVGHVTADNAAASGPHGIWSHVSLQPARTALRIWG